MLRLALSLAAALSTATAQGIGDFENAAPASLERLVTPGLGTWTAGPGHAEITDRFAASGRHCLHVLGGVGRTVQLDLERPTPGATILTARAERWTQRTPWSCVFEARTTDDSWIPVLDGADIRVGARFLSTLTVPIPAGTTALRVRTTAPESTGLLLDDVALAPAQPLHLGPPQSVPWIAPAMAGERRAVLARIALPITGHVGALALTSVTIEGSGPIIALGAHIDGDHRLESLPIGKDGTVRLQGSLPLDASATDLWITGDISADTVGQEVTVACTALTVAGKRHVPAGLPETTQRIGALVRARGQDDCHTYRIPGLVRTNQGTLIAAYDCRYRGSQDLPADVDVGVSRSEDGGRTWSPLQIAMDMGNDPAFRFDGIGDPAILVDRQTNAIWIAATWSHGNRSWHGSGPGLTPDETGQLMLARSDDDGRTWSEPINITKQIKNPEWRFVLQGPGAGITTKGGTLVFAAQFRSSDASPHRGKPFSTILWSEDRGATWSIGTGVEVDTTEAQVVELGDGSLMLNCRDNRGGARSIYTTRDLGKTWQEHPTSRRALREPVCMASLIAVRRAGSTPLLLFSNPDSKRQRHRMTVKASLDNGRTWPATLQLLYDERGGYGYSCLAPLDDEHVGVLYEGVRELRFLRIPREELLPASARVR